MSAHPESLEHSARRVVRRLREAGFVAYYAGGCVRDMALGKAPKDYDVATSATPEEGAADYLPGVLIGLVGVLALVGVVVWVMLARKRFECLRRRNEPSDDVHILYHSPPTAAAPRPVSTPPCAATWLGSSGKGRVCSGQSGSNRSIAGDAAVRSRCACQ